MNTHSENNPIIIFAGNYMEAGMVKSLLENADINAYLQDEMMGTLSPWYVAPGGAGSVKVLVSDLDSEKARIIVDEYEENLKD